MKENGKQEEIFLTVSQLTQINIKLKKNKTIGKQKNKQKTFLSRMRKKTNI